jgi:hypothetical protein
VKHRFLSGDVVAVSALRCPCDRSPSLAELALAEGEIFPELGIAWSLDGGPLQRGEGFGVPPLSGESDAQKLVEYRRAAMTGQHAPRTSFHVAEAGMRLWVR